jgi:hypothetical protein
MSAPQLSLVSFLNTFVERVTLERDLQRTLGFTDDFAEGAKAFLEKHKPVFTGSQEHHRPPARGPHSPLPDTASSAGEPLGRLQRPMPVAKQNRLPAPRPSDIPSDSAELSDVVHHSLSVCNEKANSYRDCRWGNRWDSTCDQARRPVRPAG